MTRVHASVVFAMSFAAMVACNKKEGSSEATAAAAPATIAIDGSSTVYPITEAVAEDFQEGHANVRVTVGVSGTGGGFKKFCAGEIAITGASRPIKDSEVEKCRAADIEYIELPVAYDGIAIVVSKQNDWVDSITVSELKRLWQPEAQGTITKWNQIRPSWPDREIHLFGAGVDSGTYDYFTAAIVGTEHSSRGDFTSSEDDNVLVQGVSTDPGALGFFGFAYYHENSERLRAIPVDNDANAEHHAVAPSQETIATGTYQPLSRPIFIYVSKTAAARAEVREFIEFYLTQKALVREVGYIPLPDRAYELATQRFKTLRVGSVFGGHGSRIGVTVEKLLEGS